MFKPLEGVKVIDLTYFVAVPGAVQRFCRSVQMLLKSNRLLVIRDVAPAVQ